MALKLFLYEVIFRLKILPWKQYKVVNFFVKIAAVLKTASQYHTDSLNIGQFWSFFVIGTISSRSPTSLTNWLQNQLVFSFIHLLCHIVLSILRHYHSLFPYTNTSHKYQKTVAIWNLHWKSLFWVHILCNAIRNTIHILY